MSLKTIFKTIRRIAFPVSLDAIFNKEYTGSKVTTQRKFDAEMQRLGQQVTKENVMNERGSKQPVLCACGCGGPLSTNHLSGQIYVTLADGKSVLINMSCYLSAYGEGKETVVTRILELLPKENINPGLKARLLEESMEELTYHLALLEELTDKCKQFEQFASPEGSAQHQEKRGEILTRMMRSISELSQSKK